MNTLVYGTRKQGKSTLSLALAIEAHPRVVIFDPNNQYPLIVSIDILDLDEWLQTHNGSNYQLVRVGPFDTTEIWDIFAVFSEALWHERNISIIIDEAHLLQGSNSMHPDLDRWNRRSSSSVLVIASTHRIVDAHPDSRYHADDVFFFYASLDRELKSIRENFGGTVAVAIPRLTRYQVIHWAKKPGGIPVWYVWDNGADWFIDLENENA